MKRVSHGFGLCYPDLNFPPVNARTAGFDSRVDATCILLSFMHDLPRFSIIDARSVQSFSCREKSKDISPRLGQLMI